MLDEHKNGACMITHGARLNSIVGHKRLHTRWHWSTDSSPSPSLSLSLFLPPNLLFLVKSALGMVRGRALQVDACALQDCRVGLFVAGNNKVDLF